MLNINKKFNPNKHMREKKYFSKNIQANPGPGIAELVSDSSIGTTHVYESCVGIPPCMNFLFIILC